MAKLGTGNTCDEAFDNRWFKYDFRDILFLKIFIQRLYHPCEDTIFNNAYTEAPGNEKLFSQQPLRSIQ